MIITNLYNPAGPKIDTKGESILPKPKNMLIIVAIIGGAVYSTLVKSVHHLITISKSIQPKVTVSSNI
jgi:hypothetical protein